MGKENKEKGVASVIGTLFALLLAVTILSAFMTQYVPVYMKTNEAQHDIEVLSDFSQIKTFTDLLVATGEENYSFSVPVTMGANGIPIFAPSTPSMLQISPSPNPIFSLNISNNGKNYYQNSSGFFSTTIYNSYYPEEKIIFANGAVIRENVNENSSTVYVGPGFSIKNSSKGYVLNFIIYNVLGPSNSYSGTDTLNLQISLLGIQKITYTAINKMYANISVNNSYSFANSLVGWYYNQSELFGFSPPIIKGNFLSFGPVYEVNVEIAYMNVQFSSY
ncbi:MAG: hypothetical protein ACP5F1_00630 [Thermoplasmata archaeon]|nr:hypothetical protein [Thermoplasmata archaeon]